MANLLKWKVEEAPSGPYRSFQKRGWPSANYKNANESAAADISCVDSYTSALAKNGNHAELVVRIADHSQKPWKWVKLKARFNTLDEAKQGVLDFLEKYPKYKPSDI